VYSDFDDAAAIEILAVCKRQRLQLRAIVRDHADAVVSEPGTPAQVEHSELMTPLCERNNLHIAVPRVARER